jgi:hypothetical protein
MCQSELPTQTGLTAALMGVLELLTPQHHILLWRSDSAVLGITVLLGYTVRSLCKKNNTESAE